MPMERKSKLTTNYFFNLLNRIVVIVIPLITTPYLTRVLGSSELGTYNYANTIASYFVMIAMMGMSILGNKRISLSRADENTDYVFSNLITIQIVNTIVCSIAYIGYIVLFCKNGKTIAWIQLLYVLSALFDISWFLQGLENFKSIAIRNVIINIISTILIFGFVKSNDDIIVYTLIKSISILASQLLLVMSCANNIKLLKPNIRYIIEAYKQLLILFIPVAAESIFHNMDRVMLGAMVSYSAVAIYYTSRMITDIPQCLVTSVNTIMYPRITALVGQNNTEAANKYTYISFELINAMCVAMAFGIAGIAEDFVAWYLGIDYQYCANCLPWLTPYIVLAAWNGTVRYQFLLPKSMNALYSKAIVIGIGCNLILNALLIPRIGIIGAILATVISEFIIGVIQTYKVIKEMRILNHFMNILLYTVIGALMYFLIKTLSTTINSPLWVKVVLEIGLGAIFFTAITLPVITLVDKDIRSFFRTNIFDRKRIR